MQHVGKTGHINHVGQVQRLLANANPTNFQTGMIYADERDDADIELVEEISEGVWSAKTRCGQFREVTTAQLNEWTRITGRGPDIGLEIFA